MTKEQILENIENLLPVLHEYRTKGEATITIEQKILLKSTYLNVYRINPDVACNACCLQYLSFLEAFYEREKAKVLTQEVSTQKVITQEEPVKQPVKVKQMRRK